MKDFLMIFPCKFPVRNTIAKMRMHLHGPHIAFPGHNAVRRKIPQNKMYRILQLEKASLLPLILPKQFHCHRHMFYRSCHAAPPL